MARTDEIMQLTPEACEAAEACKMRGNDFFKAGDFAAAIRCYDEAIAIDGGNHVFFGNRSAARGCAGDWTSAADDARVSVNLDPRYTKGFYRLAQALFKSGDSSNAAAAVESGLHIDPDNREMLSLRRRLRGGRHASVERKRNSRRSGSGAIKAVGLGSVSLYDDKEGLEDVEGVRLSDDARALRRIFRSLRDSTEASNSALGAGGCPHEIEGFFRKLTNPQEFRRIVMPGLSDEQRRDVPNTLKELLRSPLYASAVEESIPRVVAHAASVLEGVKERGRKVGDIMDAATEKVLKPQILQEAFAREVIKVISAVHATARAKAASERGRLASPNCEEATWDQLNDDAVKSLLTKRKGYAVQDSFLGEGWASVLLDDSLRFQEGGRLGPAGVEREHGEMAWVELEELQPRYPGLHELLTSLHALPFELNLREPRLGLALPFRGSTMLLRLTEGCQVPPRLDSFAGGAETGHRVSAVYFIGRKGEDGAGDEGGSATARERGGQLRLQNVESPLQYTSASKGSGAGTGEDDGEETAETFQPSQQILPSGEGGGEMGSSSEEVLPGSVVLEPMADRLVLFRSDRVCTQTLEVQGHGQEQYAVLFWMHRAMEGEV